MNDRRHTAVHEAGHAVIGRAMTLLCAGASIAADEDSAGHGIIADPHMTLHQWELREKWRGTAMGGLHSAFVGRNLAYMAGAEAEILGSPLDGGDADDRYQVALMLYEIEPEDRHGAKEARLRRVARQLVRRHRAGIKRVADALAEREALTGEEIDAILPPGFMARPVTWTMALSDE